MQGSPGKQALAHYHQLHNVQFSLPIGIISLVTVLQDRGNLCRIKNILISGLLSQNNSLPVPSCKVSGEKAKVKTLSYDSTDYQSQSQFINQRYKINSSECS